MYATCDKTCKDVKLVLVDYNNVDLNLVLLDNWIMVCIQFMNVRKLIYCPTKYLI